MSWELAGSTTVSCKLWRQLLLCSVKLLLLAVLFLPHIDARRRRRHRLAQRMGATFSSGDRGSSRGSVSDRALDSDMANHGMKRAAPGRAPISQTMPNTSNNNPRPPLHQQPRHGHHTAYQSQSRGASQRGGVFPPQSPMMSPRVANVSRGQQVCHAYPFPGQDTNRAPVLSMPSRARV